MVQPSCGGAKRFDPTTGVKVTHRLRACNQKKIKNILEHDDSKTSDWRGFPDNRASRSTVDAGVESVPDFEFKRRVFARIPTKDCAETRYG
jgi:hypothetical protein